MTDTPPAPHRPCTCRQPGLGGDCDGSCTHPEPGAPFARTRRLIADAIEEAIFDAFDMEPPEGNSCPIRRAEQERDNG